MKDRKEYLLWYALHGCDTAEKIKASEFKEQKAFVKAGVVSRDEAKADLRKRFDIMGISFTEKELETEVI